MPVYIVDYLLYQSFCAACIQHVTSEWVEEMFACKCPKFICKISVKCTIYVVMTRSVVKLERVAFPGSDDETCD